MCTSCTWRTRESCHLWSISRVQLSHAQSLVPWLMYTAWYDSILRVIWLIHMWDMPYSCVTWRKYLCERNDFDVLYYRFPCVMWLVYTRDMTHSYIDKTQSYVSCLIPTCDVARPYVRHVSFICVTLQIHTCYMPRIRVWHDSLIFGMIHSYVSRLISTCDVACSYVRHDSFICVT